MNKDEQATHLKQQGNHAYKSADYKKALQLYTKAIEINPKDPAFYLNRALCYFNMKNFHECITECNKSIQLNSAYIKAIKKKAAALVQLLKFDQALAALKLANSIEKTQSTSNDIEQVQHYISNFNKYNEALKTQDYSQALSCVSYLIQKIPQNKELLLIKIQCLAKTGATEEAAKSLRVVDHQKTPETMYLKGIIELYSGDSAKAKSYFGEGIRLDPENAKCQKALNKASKCEKFKEEGNELIKSSNWQSAQAKYSEALNLDPYNKKLNAIIYSNRALTYMKRKMWTKAAEDLNRSIELNPNYIKSYVRRAEVSMERGEYTAAIQDYAKIQELDPKISMKAKIQEAKKKEKEAKKKDYYAILGVAKTATDEQIKKAYKKMALKYHPDRNRNKSQVEQEEAAKMFRDINEAQDVLTKPEKRKMYDSGGMSFDEGTGADSSNFGNGGFSNMGGFGGNGQSFKFSFNGQDMGGMQGGMGGTDPSKIFEMFLGGGMPGFGSSFGQRRKSAQKTSETHGKNQFKGFGGFDDFDFNHFGNMGSYGKKQEQKPKRQK